MLHKIHTFPFHSLEERSHSSPFHNLDKRADEVSTTTTLAPPSNKTAAINTTVPANATLSGANETKLVGGTNSSSGTVNTNDTVKANGTLSAASVNAANGTLSTASPGANNTAQTSGNTSSTVPTTVAPSTGLSWTTIIGDGGGVNSKESSEECPFGFLQCFCDAVTDMLVGSNEEDDDEDRLTDGIFGIFGK